MSTAEITPPRSRTRTAELAAGTVFAVFLLALSAKGAAQLTGSPAAGFVVMLAGFAACWAAHRFASRQHPAPARRRAPGRDPGHAGPVLSGTRAAA